MGTAASSSNQTSRPGFGRRVDDETLSAEGGGGGPYEHALASAPFQSRGVTVRERRMLEFMGQITDKPEWQRKVHDEGILGKWREEAARVIDVDGIRDVYLSEQMFDYCIKELRDKVEYSEKTGIVTVLDAELYLAKSDTIVPAELLERLKQAVAPLEDVPESQRDWHPGSDGKVLDLLHPSLFPLRYGLTRVLTEGKVPLEECVSFTGKGEVTDKFDPATTGDPHFWGVHQWLPSDLKWTTEGLKLDSYVNNLHPKRHKGLYKVLEDFATAAVPLLEHVVVKTYPDKEKGDLPVEPRFDVRDTSDEDYSLPEGVVYPGLVRPRPDADGAGGDSETAAADELTEDEINDIMWSEEYREWNEAHRVLNQIEPEAYSAPRLPRNKPDFRTQFPRGLQIIFKLASIHLTPEKPTYDGGSWHIEGALNEHICATALYYYDQDNISDSHLAFRHKIDDEDMMMVPAQGEYSSLEAYMGIQQEETTVQHLGQVLTREGRMLAFPNVMQHQVQPFSLVDKSRPGHRKILAMFLVDPHFEVLSTSVVPPQRRDWWAEEASKLLSRRALPREMCDMICDQVDGFPISWEDALVYREELMAERSNVVGAHEELWQDMSFNFCEH